jgi:hypothetical protein
MMLANIKDLATHCFDTDLLFIKNKSMGKENEQNHKLTPRWSRASMNWSSVIILTFTFRVLAVVTFLLELLGLDTTKNVVSARILESNIPPKPTIANLYLEMVLGILPEKQK